MEIRSDQEVTISNEKKEVEEEEEEEEEEQDARGLSASGRYLEQHLSELEENYAHLRQIGLVRREQDTNQLDSLRLVHLDLQRKRSAAVCSETLDALFEFVWKILELG